MIAPGVPRDEAERLAALRALGILDSLPEPAYDDITRLAAYVCRTPIALVTLIDDDRQWFKSRYGLDLVQTPRAASFCGHVVADGLPLEVPDTRADARFADSPLVTGPPHVRFYAGAPLITPDGHALGTVCVMDRAPRTLTGDQRQLLDALVRQVMHLFELRGAAERVDRATRWQTLFFELSPDMLCVAGFDGYFKYLNPSWERVLGYPVRELTKAPFLDFVHPDDRDRTRAEAAVLVGGGHDTIAFENRYRHRDGGYRWLMWSVTTDADNQLMLAVARDITDHKRGVAELHAAVEAADRANRSKSVFLANMSHELRTPLNAVIGFASLLTKNKAGNQRPEDLIYLDRIVANGRHLLSLLDDILDLSKIEVGGQELASEPVDVAAVAAEAVGQLEAPAHAKGLEIAIDAAPGLAPVKADRLRLKQVVINLLDNALKFTRAGRVDVVVVAEPGTDRPARLDVIDTGIGIEPDRLDEIFEAFRQADSSTSRRYGGTGLGLTIARSLCRMMGFDLVAASTPGAGATFSVVLSETAPAPVHAPLQASTSQLLRAARAMREDGGDVRRRVLIIDADVDARLRAQRVVEDLGHQAIGVGSGALGVQLAPVLGPDVVVVGIAADAPSLPSLLRALRRAGTGGDPAAGREALPIVVYAPGDVIGAAREAVAAGAADTAAVVTGDVESELRAAVAPLLEAAR